MSDNRPLSGIRVFELGIAIAGPVCCRYLHHFGAEIIKCESRKGTDGARRGVSWLSPEQVGREVWGDTFPNDFAAGKKSVGLDTRTPEGMAVARRLISKCDVFVTNLSAPAVKGLGFGYEVVREIKPDIIYAQISGFGATPGPYYNFKTWGPNLAPLVGLDDLTGWPDRAPSGSPNIAVGDYMNALYGAFAVLTALDHRDRTGEGQYIDLSQFESTTSLGGPQLLDYEYNGHCQERIGNRLAWAAPQGVYPCRGKDRWVAVSVLTEEEWLAFCHVIGHPEWAEDERFRTVDDRLTNHDTLDDLIAGWTSQHTAPEVAEWLQTAGVGAGPVQDIPGIATDPQLQARNFWILADHARFRKDLVTGNPINLSDTPGYHERGTPSLGQDNDYVLRDVCGYSEAEIQALVEKEVVFPMARPDVQFERPYLRWIRHFMPHLPWPEPGN